MKTIRLYTLLTLIIISTISCKTQQKYAPTWESLSQNEIPEWMLDAKFGVYTHWGIYSVPAFATPSYVNELYLVTGKDSKGIIAYHEEKFGKRSEFGYIDFIPMFSAEKFNADEWVGLMDEAGAKFGGICLVHHDGFLLWDSKYSRWNSKNMGPKRDIYGEIAQAVRKREMKLAATFHHGRTYGFAFDRHMDAYTDEHKKNWDIFDPKFSDFYWNPETAPKEEFAKLWKSKITEVIDNYSPDMIWFDGLRTQMRNNIVPDTIVRQVIAHYFNDAQKKNKKVTIANKLPAFKDVPRFNFPKEFGLLCYENARDMPEYQENYWLTDRAIAYPWTYVHNKNYRNKADYHLRSLVDIVSRGGIFFLSLTPMGDGSIHQEEQNIMRNIGKWLKVNGEAIYNTRRWKAHGEGTTVMTRVTKEGKTKWNYADLSAKDVRFTRSKDNKTLYAIVLGLPDDNKYIIKLLNSNEKIATNGIKDITLLGTEEKVEWTRDKKGLTISFPKQTTEQIAYAFKITVNGTLIN